MYASTRIQTVPRSPILAAILVATLVIGAGAGYAAGTAAALGGARSSVETRDQLELNAAFRTGERQGSAENPDAAAGPANIAFLQSEHVRSSDVTGPANIPFLQSEHVGSSENPAH